MEEETYKKRGRKRNREKEKQTLQLFWQERLI